MKTYTVQMEREDDGWWIARVVGVKGVHSNGRTIEEALRRVREALSLAVDDSDEASLVPDVKLPMPLKSLLQRQRDARELAAKQQNEASDLQTQAAKALTGFGLSLRDAGSLLGVSHSMASKALRGSRSATRTRTRAQHGKAPAKRR